MIKILNFVKQKLISLKSYKKIKIIFFKKTEIKVIIFDRLSGEYLLDFFQEKDFFIIDVPGERRNVQNLYFSFPIFKSICFEIIRGNLTLCYWIALIKQINPKLVITFSDNNYDFHKISKILDKKYKFISIQNAYRDESYLSEEKAKKIFIQNYLCFGKQTVSHLSDLGFNIKNFYVTGSLRQCLAEKEIINNLQDEKYDLGLISENIPDKNDPVKNERILSLKIIAENVKKYTSDYNLNTVILLKRDPDTKRGKQEINFYKEIFSNTKITFRDTKKNQFSNYYTAYNCNIVIGSRSTLLLEVLSKGKKILVCNYKDQSNFKMNAQRKYNRYTELNPLINKNKIISTNDLDYMNFKKKLDYLTSIDMKDYKNSLKGLQDYMLVYDEQFTTFDKIKKIISKCLI
jgi:surface carbohydrate biosynthesis protein